MKDKIRQFMCNLRPVLTLQGWDWRGHTYLYILGDAKIVCTRCGQVKYAYHLHNTEPRAKELLANKNVKVPHQ